MREKQPEIAFEVPHPKVPVVHSTVPGTRGEQHRKNDA